MRYISSIIFSLLFVNLVICEIENAKNEQLTESSLDKATIVEKKLTPAETKLKESESNGHKKIEIKQGKGADEKFHKENNFKKKDEAHSAKASSDKAAHEKLKVGEESSKMKKKKSDELGHDEGKKTASKTKKSGDHLDSHWDKGEGFIKKWSYDRGSKKRKGYHHEDEGKLKKYNKAYKQEHGMVSKGKHKKFKKHDGGWKNSWDSGNWGHNKGAYGHDVKKGGNHHSGYFKKAKADEYHDGWNKGWGEHDNQHHHGHNDGYDWRF